MARTAPSANYRRARGSASVAANDEKASRTSRWPRWPRQNRGRYCVRCASRTACSGDGAVLTRNADADQHERRQRDHHTEDQQPAVVASWPFHCGYSSVALKSAAMYLMNQLEHSPALSDEVRDSHGPDPRSICAAMEDGGREDDRLVPGRFVLAPERVRLRPDRDAVAFAGCLDHGRCSSFPLHSPFSLPEGFCLQPCLMRPGEHNQGFRVENPG